MSVETQQINTAVADLSGTDAIQTSNDTPVSEDAALEAVWEQSERDNNAARGEDGRFISANQGDQPENEVSQPKGDGEGDATEEGAVSTPEATTVALPPNWNGMEEDWKKIPADVQAKLAARDADIHSRMSDQGRQLSAARPVMDVVQRNADVYARHKMPDGSAITPEHGVEFLLNAQRSLDENPIRALIDIAGRYDVLPQLAAVLTGQAQIPASQTPQPAAVSAADIKRMVQEGLSETAQVNALNEELGRLTASKPLYAEIPEEDMVFSINKARAKLGDTASREAVFNLAYDMAVNADPDLRAKAAAAKTAAVIDPQKTEQQKRATSVNVKSTQSGKGRQLTEDELLAQAFDAAHAKD